MKFIQKVSARLGALLPRNHFARGVSVLVGGAAGSQLLMLLAAPLLTRLYTPEDFGLLAICVGVLAMFGAIASFRYEGAITLPEDNVEAANVAALCLVTVLLMTSVSVVV